MAKQPTLGFIFNTKKQGTKVFVDSLISRYNGVAPEAADILVPVGGDGSVLHVLPQSRGRIVYGLVPPDSESVGYTANRFDPDEDLQQAIAAALRYPVYPLDTRLQFFDGTETRLNVFNSASLVSDNGQAAKLDLTGNFNGVAQTLRLVGDGVAFSTLLGSTGLALSHGGPIMSPTQKGMIMTALGTGWPLGIRPVVATDDRDFFTVLSVLDDGDRPLRFNFDGRSIRPEQDNPIAGLNITISKKSWSTIAVKAGSFHPFKRLMIG
jgi:NAD+ kinase